MPDKLRPPLGRIAVAQRDVGGKYDKDDLLTFFNEHGGDLQNGPFFYCVKTTEAHRAELVSFAEQAKSLELIDGIHPSVTIHSGRAGLARCRLVRFVGAPERRQRGRDEQRRALFEHLRPQLLYRRAG